MLNHMGLNQITIYFKMSIMLPFIHSIGLVYMYNVIDGRYQEKNSYKRFPQCGDSIIVGGLRQKFPARSRG